MIEEFSHPDYIDVKDDIKVWRVGKVLSKGIEGYKIRLDGDSPINDFTIGASSERLAPFRQYTKGSSGEKITNRCDPLVGFEKINQISELITRFSQKHYDQLDASYINCKLRGRVYLFIHSLFTRKQMSLEDKDIKEMFNFLFKFLEFIVRYLRVFSKSLYEKFDEGLKDCKKIVTQPDVAYSHFLFEALEALKQIFGAAENYSSFFDRKFQRRALDKFKLNYNDPNVVDQYEIRNKSSPDWGSLDEVRIIEDENISFKEFLGEVMINRFAALGGFSLLIKVISGENRIKNNGNLLTIMRSDTLQIEDEPKISSLEAAFEILDHLTNILKKFQINFKNKLFIEIQEKLLYRLKSITDSEIKEIDIEVPKSLFQRLEKLSTELTNQEQLYKEREITELEVFLKFLESSRLEKKLKGLEEIKRYITRIEASFVNSWVDEKQLHYFDRSSFIKWILDNEVLSLIYTKYQHVELIKRSISIQKFIVRNSETLPDGLLTLLWESCQNNQGEVLTAIYENILELAPDLDVEGAFSLFALFNSMNIENYDEEFVDLICKFTENCLKLVVENSTQDVLKIKQEFKNYQKNLFGLPKMFEIIMDDSPVGAEISQRVLACLLSLVNEFFILSIYAFYGKKCIQNIKENTSIYQSLAYLNDLFSQMISKPSLIPICQKYFEPKFTGEDSLLISLISAYEKYWKNVRERIKILMASNNFERDETKWMQEIFVGKFSHELNVTQVLNSLKFFIAQPYPSQPLTFNQFKRLWTCFVVKMNFEFETKLFLELISQMYEVKDKGFVTLFSMGDLKEIFTEIICQEMYFNPKKFSIEKFKCFRFFFLLINYKENNIIFENNEDDMFKEENTNYIQVLDTQLIGLDTLWEYFVSCNDDNISNELNKLLVVLHTKFGPNRKGEEETLYEYTIIKIMKSIEISRKKKDLEAIERYILFLDKFLESIDRKTSASAFEPYQNDTEIFSGGLIKVNVKYYPYEDIKQMEIHIREKLGYIKEKIAKQFEVEIHEFDIFIDNDLITDENLDDQLKDYLNLQNIEMRKRNDDLEFSSLNYRLVKQKEYIEQFFRLFASFEPEIERLKKVWNFFRKLPLQSDIKDSTFESKDYSEVLEGSQELENSTLLKVCYYALIVRELALIDPYYWKMKQINLRAVKSEWAAKFVAGKGVDSIIQLIKCTDLRRINNFLFLKTILLLYQMLNFFFLSYEEMKIFWTEEFFTKSLDVLLYSAKYVASESSAGNIQQNTLKDFTNLSKIIKNLLQSMLKSNKKFCETFLLYPNLKNLYMEIFVNLCNEGQVNESQDHFAEFMNVLFDTLQSFPEKQMSTKLFNILFENIAFAALESPKPTLFILKYLAEFLKKYDLQKHFNCSLDIYGFMSRIVTYIKDYQPSQGQPNEKKIEACFYFLKRYLVNNLDKLDQIGQAQGLTTEILSQGLLKTPSQDNNDKPKYQTQGLISLAFENLSLLSKSEKNFRTITKYLSPIHANGTWRSYKYSSWNLSTKVKKRVTPYSGLKNLGCTCYMNSTLQQLFMIPTFSKTLLQLQDPDFKKEDIKDNILFQLKRLFYGMTHVEKEFFSPKKFCLSFKDIEGNPTSFREQKDAFEFLCLLLDRLEEKVKKTKHENFIKDFFGGSFSNELICKDCPHYYDREEAFLGVNLIVKNSKDVKESLENFVEGQTLSGENAYLCEECNKKVTAVKRVSFKALPNCLIFVLNRFEYNFDRNMREKINDYYEFSQELDLEPFTQQAIKNAEKDNNFENKSISQLSKSKTLKDIKQKIIYDLKGAVIHVGSAESGHYYSIIKDSKNGEEGQTKWLEFNDQHVTEFDIKNLPSAAFGDKYNSRSAQSAYILVYEKRTFVEENGGIKRKVKIAKDFSGLKNGRMELEEINLVDRLKIAEKNSIEEFQKEISEKNLKLFYIEKLLSAEYSQFIRNLINYTEEITGESCEDNRFFLLFVFVWTVFVTTILRAPENNLQSMLFEWIYKKLASEKIAEYILGHFSNHEFFTEMLLQCPKEEPKKYLISIIHRAFRMIYTRDSTDQAFLITTNSGLLISSAANLLYSMIDILPKTKCYLKSLNTYFGLLRSLMSIHLDITKLLLKNKIIGRLAYYFFCTKDEALFKEFKSKLEYNEIEIKLHYGPEIMDDPNQNNDEDFTTPGFVNLTKFFSVLWELLSHSSISGRESYSKFKFHKSGINYKLDSSEVKILDLTSYKIRKMFSYVNREEIKPQKTICKIIAFLTYGSGDDFQPILDFLDQSLNLTKASEKQIADCLRLIRIIGKINDNFQIERNKIFLNKIVSAITKRTNTVFQLNELTQILRKMVETNYTYVAILKDDQRNIAQVLSAIRAAILDDSDSIISKPTNYQVWEAIKKNLTRQREFFSNVRTLSTSSSTICDSEDELDDINLSQYKKGQNVEFYDENVKKSIKGTIEGVYDNILKIKVVVADGSSYYKWLDETDVEDDRFKKNAL